MPNEHLARVINVNFSTNNIETQKREQVKRNKQMNSKGKWFDLLSNSLKLLFKEIYRDQSGEFVCGYWDLKG